MKDKFNIRRKYNSRSKEVFKLINCSIRSLSVGMAQLKQKPLKSLFKRFEGLGFTNYLSSITGASSLIVSATTETSSTVAASSIALTVDTGSITVSS